MKSALGIAAVAAGLALAAQWAQAAGEWPDALVYLRCDFRSATTPPAVRFGGMVDYDLAMLRRQGRRTGPAYREPEPIETTGQRRFPRPPLLLLEMGGQGMEALRIGGANAYLPYRALQAEGAPDAESEGGSWFSWKTVLIGVGVVGGVALLAGGGGGGDDYASNNNTNPTGAEEPGERCPPGTVTQVCVDPDLICECIP
ncbi:MAG TPA: hypothetical protein VM074_12025 [Solimonas sp.]|nr:hypothetical protein [Solimonas sp.]